MENGPRTETPENSDNHYRPILCRTLDEETGIAIEAMVAVELFHSVAEGLGLLAQEGLALRLREQPQLNEVIDLYRQMRAVKF